MPVLNPTSHVPQLFRKSLWGIACSFWIASSLVLADPPEESTNTTPSVATNTIGTETPFITWISVGTTTNFFNISSSCITANQYCTFLNAVASTDDPYHLYAPQMGNLPKPDMHGVLPKVPTITCQQTNGTMVYSVVNGTNEVVLNNNFATYNGDLPTTYGDLPMNNVSLFDAARFCNWLQHGMPTAPEGPDTTEGGAYTIDEAYNPVTKKYQAIYQTITLMPGALFCIPDQERYYGLIDPVTKRPQGLYDCYGLFYSKVQNWEWTASTYEIGKDPVKDPHDFRKSLHPHYGNYWQVNGPNNARNKFTPGIKLVDSSFRVMQISP